MPKSFEHERTISDNQNILHDLDDKVITHDYFGWRVVIIFYTALHLIEKHLYQKRHLHIYSHREREEYMNENLPYRNLIIDYKTLENQSKRARYNCVNITENDFQDAIECLNNIESELRQ